VAISLLNFTGIVSNSGWTDVSLVTSSDNLRASDGAADDTFIIGIEDSPGDFSSLNTVLLRVEALVVGTVSRDKTLKVDLLDSSDTQLETFTTGVIGATDSTFVSSAFTRSDSAAVIDGYRLRVTVLEGGGMPDSATVNIDLLELEIDYDLPPNQIIQRQFQFRQDDDTEADATNIGAKNSDQLLQPDTNYRIRIGIDNPGGSANPADNFPFDSARTVARMRIWLRTARLVSWFSAPILPT